MLINHCHTFEFYSLTVLFLAMLKLSLSTMDFHIISNPRLAHVLLHANFVHSSYWSIMCSIGFSIKLSFNASNCNCNCAILCQYSILANTIIETKNKHMINIVNKLIYNKLYLVFLPVKESLLIILF